jgi:hypothetical protein
MTDSPEICDEALRFYQDYVGIEDRNELINHLQIIQKELIDVNCEKYKSKIKTHGFFLGRHSELPMYSKI